MSGLNFSYQIAQRALADLKTAVFMLLQGEDKGLTNMEIAKGMGIYYAQNDGHEGLVSGVLLEIMKAEGVVEHDNSSKKWKLSR